MSEEIKKLQDNCVKAVLHFKTELGKLRGGRASTSLIESIKVDYYGAQTPLKQMGNINAPEPRQLTVQVYDASAIESVEKAIRQSELGLNPARDGNIIRINIPALTEERRKDLIKALHKMTEEARVVVRNHRRDANEELKKKKSAKDVSEDDIKRTQDDVQKLTDKTIAEIDQILAVKEKEMLEV